MTINTILTHAFKFYVRIEEYCKRVYNSILPYEKNIYCIKDSKKSNVTLQYYMCILHYYLVLYLSTKKIIYKDRGVKANYIVEFRPNDVLDYHYKAFMNKNLWHIFNHVRKNNYKKKRIIMKRPMCTIKLKVDNANVPYDFFKKLCLFDSNDKLVDIYKLFFNKNVNKIELIHGLKKEYWENDDANNVTVGMIFK